MFERIDIVAHSRGGRLAQDCALHSRTVSSFPADFADTFPIGRLITLGAVRTSLTIGSFISPPSYHKDSYEITGKYDTLVTAKSELAPARSLEVDAGHLGLVYSDAAHQKIIHWLSANP